MKVLNIISGLGSLIGSLFRVNDVMRDRKAKQAAIRIARDIARKFCDDKKMTDHVERAKIEERAVAIAVAQVAAGTFVVEDWISGKINFF